MLIGFLFKSMSYSTAFLFLGGAVFAVGLVVLTVRLMSKKVIENKVIEPRVVEEAVAA